LRTVGDAVGPVARESERPVDEVLKDMGSDEVWRVSFGRESAGRLGAFEVRPQDMLECGCDAGAVEG
jgi:hypothetical protein